MPSPSRSARQVALALLAASAGVHGQATSTSTSTSTSTATTPTATAATYSFEIGAIFPRANATYKSTDILPLAFSVHNFDAILASGGNYTFRWDIMPYSAEGVPGGVTYDNGEVPLPAAGAFNHTVEGTPETTYTVLVDGTNVTDWIRRKDRGDYFILHWHVRWAAFGGAGACGQATPNVFGGVFFDIEAPWEDNDSYPSYGLGVDVDVVAAAAGRCPDFAPPGIGGSVVNVTPNATRPSCSIVLDGSYDPGSGRTADPCVVRIDESVASEIAAQATSTVLARAAPTPTPSSDVVSGLKNAALREGPGPAALAAAVAFGWLALS